MLSKEVYKRNFEKGFVHEVMSDTRVYVYEVNLDFGLIQGREADEVQKGAIRKVNIFIVKV